jgi:hypothetical protein
MGVSQDFTNPTERQLRCGYLLTVRKITVTGLPITVLAHGQVLHSPLTYAFLCELGDLLDDLLRGGLQPRRGGARVREGRSRYTLSVAVKTTHFGV